MQVAPIRSIRLLALVLCTSVAGCKSKEPPQAAAVGAPTSTLASAAPHGAQGAATAMTNSRDGGLAPDAGMLKADAPLVPAKTRSTSYCAIFATYPASARASAELGREKIAKTGVEGVTIRETSEFAELAWGQLVIVSVANTRQEAEARSGKGSLATKGFVKACRELSGTFEVSKEPAEKKINADSSGCPGWNPQKKSAICITEEGSLQRGFEDTVTFLGGGTSAEEKDFTWLNTPALSFDSKVDPKVVARTKAALAKGGHRSLTDYRVRDLEPGDEALWAVPKFSIRYERRMRPGITVETGSWNSVSDRIILDCKGEKQVLFEADMEGVDEQPLSLYWSPENKLLLAKWRMHFGREGDNGGLTKAKLIDFATTCVP